MTLQTSLVVISRLFSDLLVRVVTRNAAYISIIRITLAVEDTVRLKTNVVDFHTLQQRKLIGATMTGTAKVLCKLIAAEQSGIVDRLGRRIACFRRRDVPSSWSMTAFAAHAVRKIVET
jgi:hypothetical protein